MYAYKEMGTAVETVGIALTVLLAYRLSLDINPKADIKALELRSQERQKVNGKTRIPDVTVNFHAENFVLNAEIKWIGEGQNIKYRFKGAYKKLSEIINKKLKNSEQIGHKIFVLFTHGDILSADDILSTLKVDGLSIDFSFVLANGTCIHQFTEEDGAKMIIALLADESTADYHLECAKAWALYLTRPPELNALDLKEKKELSKAAEKWTTYLAGSSLLPTISKITQPPKYCKEHLYHQLNIEDSNALRRFMLDPWSHLLHYYLDIIRKKDEGHRWVSLLKDAIKGRESHPSRMIDKLINNIPPMPISCGHAINKQVIHQLALSINHNLSADIAKPTTKIKIVRGPSGTGKSTLLDFLYRNQIQQLVYGGGAALPHGIPLLIDLQRHSNWFDNNNPDNLTEDAALAILANITGFVERDIHQDMGIEISSGPNKKYTLLGALLSKFQLYLYIDAYDQISVNQKLVLRAIGNVLKESQIKLGFLFLTSRPGHGEIEAFDWPKSFADFEGSKLDIVFTLDKPSNEAIKDYCNYWCGLVTESRGESGNSTLHLDGFLKWLNDNTCSAIKDTRTDAIQQNPLFLIMMLRIFLKRDERLRGIEINNQSDILRLLMLEASQPGIAQQSGTGTVDGATLMSEQHWMEKLELACLLSFQGIHRTSGRLETNAILKAFDIDDTQEKDVLKKLRSLPFIYTSLSEENALQVIEFVHPAFHEYLAVRCLVNKLMELVRIETFTLEDSYTQKTLLALKWQNDAITTEFGSILISLGREAFKYLMGELLSTSTEREVAEKFFHLLANDVGTQQYLYDSEYVDRCYEELIGLCKNWRAIESNSAGYYCLVKLIGHKLYGEYDKDALAEGIAHFFRVIGSSGVTHPTKDSYENVLDRWYKIFCLDHIENRIDRTNSELVNQKKMSEWFGNESETPDNVNSWLTKYKTTITKDLKAFEEADDLDDKQPDSLAQVKQPIFKTESFFILRAAHYWGHVGNRELKALKDKENIAAISRETGKVALNAYAKAIVYRLVVLYKSLGNKLTEKVTEHYVKQNENRFPTWFISWLKDQVITPEHSTQILIPFERFVGPSQAIADTANQLTARSDVFLWMLMNESSKENKQRLLGFAQKECDDAKYLWKLAQDPQISGYIGENMLRYRLQVAGVEQRLKLAKSYLNKGEVPSVLEVDTQLSTLLEDIKANYGIHYPFGQKSAQSETQTYLKRLASCH